MADELPKDVAKWSVDDVETYLTFKMDCFDEDDIKAIKGERVNGKGFLWLTEGIHGRMRINVAILFVRR
ncbi:hypothetical protein RhiirC2_754292 [Rhizophagus irregularis]|uniref:Uncharacterized protein n=1 Tax=Rhizophagus irregularis TaxID=588596 RepID=A0A2N1MWD0_9GLOM|nr:hypothetical protein RhiirC2_754292 [Rhizophagus irregularis]